MTEMLRAAAADPEQTCRAEATFRHSAGQWVPSEVTVTALLHDPHVQGFVVTVRDVGERKRLEYALTRQAYSDALTGLPEPRAVPGPRRAGPPSAGPRPDRRRAAVLRPRRLQGRQRRAGPRRR